MIANLHTYTSPATNLAPINPHCLSSLHVPPATLISCLRATLVRNTLAADLNAQQRLNFFPASPLCSLSWWFSGESVLVNEPSHASEPHRTTPLASKWMFNGPMSLPTVSWNPGSGHGMMVLFNADAMHRLTGLDMHEHVNRWSDGFELLPKSWQNMAEAVFQAPTDAQRITLIHQFFEPLWAQHMPRNLGYVQRYHDWAMTLAAQAAMTSAGRSLRQIERRIKRWAGLPMRELRGMGRSEQAYFNALLEHQTTRPNWVDIAQSVGYSDQSHLCRETKRITGFTPDALYQRIVSEEGFWAYRLWQ